MIVRDEVLYTSPIDPLARPLVDDLIFEYDSRYYDMPGRKPAIVELTKYPPERFAPPEGNFLLLLRNGEAIAGGGFMRYDDRTAELKRVWTRRDLRRQGLARRILLELEAQARRQGYSRLYLTTGSRQPEAKALYLTNGYDALFDLDAPEGSIHPLPFAKSLLWPTTPVFMRPCMSGSSEALSPDDVARLAVIPGAKHKLRIVKARYPARTAGTLFAAVVLAAILYSVLTNPRWGWDVFVKWFFAAPVWEGLARTLELTLLGAALGFAFGMLLALARVSRSPLLAWLSWGYIWVFRSIPLIVLLLVLNNLGYLYERIWIGLPFTDFVLFNASTTQLITPFAAAVIGLTLNQAAFSSEIIRGGILSVDQGQLEAAAALGLSRSRQIRRIILPQAMRTILPAAFNEIIGLAKGTSNVYILALPELFYTIQVIYRRNLEVIPLLMVATVWYLIILTVLSAIQVQIERHFARGALREPPPSLLSRLTARHKRNEADPPAPPLPIPQRRGGGEVVIRSVSKSFGAHKVLDDVSLTFASGSVTAILGQSGSGKSTLLRSINHLERVDEGLIAIDAAFVGYRLDGDTLYELKEHDILRQRADVGMVFQSFNLFPHMTVLENVAEAPVAVLGLSRLEADAQAHALLRRVGLADKASAYPRQLSGGQQQRVAIARALALRPKVLLFDEPTSALDPELVGEVLDVIRELARSGATLVVVTHEIGFAREVADTVVFMDQGKVIEQGPPHLVLGAPNHPRTREFLAKVL